MQARPTVRETPQSNEPDGTEPPGSTEVRDDLNSI